MEEKLGTRNDMKPTYTWMPVFSVVKAARTMYGCHPSTNLKEQQPDGGQDFWQRIGTAFATKEGGFIIPLTSTRLNFQWDIIKHDSYVIVTASQGNGSDAKPAPQRFVGDATLIVGAVSPHDGGVTFWVSIAPGKVLGPGQWPEPILFWTDITVFDANDPSGQN